MRAAGGKPSPRGCRQTSQSSANAGPSRTHWFWVGGEALLSDQLTSLCSWTHGTSSKAYSQTNSPKKGDVLSAREAQSNSL